MTDKHWQYTSDIVRASVDGVCLANPFLKHIETERVVFNSNTVDNKNKVSVISGGGSGHEPLHLGFVGDGLLDAAICGNIFASPSVKQIVAGINATPSDKGHVVVVKNYTGDILHFGLAAERVKAAGQLVHLLIVQDDVSVGKTKNGMVGRRGLAGTALVHKTVGAKAAMGASLDEVVKLGNNVIDNLITIGASLDRVTIPSSSADSKEASEDGSDDEKEDLLADDEVEIGMGIHNEHGIKRVSPIPTVDSLVESLLKYLLDPNDKERYYVPFEKDDEVVLMINNLGSTSNLELYAIQSIIHEKLGSIYGIKPVRIYTGAFTTSLDGPGFSITLLNATRAGGVEVMECLDAPTTAMAWNSAFKTVEWSKMGTQIVHDAPEVNHVTSDVKLNGELVKRILLKGCEDVLKVEPKVTLYDTVAGDGDCGETLAAGANAIKKALANGSLDLTDAVKFFDELGDIVESAMGGTSGGLYSIFISAMGSHLKARDNESKNEAVVLSESEMAKTVAAGLEGLQKYTRAREGDRTLMDALIPFARTFAETDDVSQAAKAAHEGAEKTRKLEAKFGRASYVGEEEFRKFDKEGGLPDPGAVGLAALINGFVVGYKG